MLDDELIHWEEGLYIQPQHLQTLQRQAVRRVAADRALTSPFPWGVVRAQLDQAALSVRGGAQVQFEQLHVVLRNGLVVNQGVNATVRRVDLSRIRDTGNQITIYLAVRTNESASLTLSEAKDSNAEGNGTDSGLYRLSRHSNVNDDNTGLDGVDITTRMINARLIAVGVLGGIPDPGIWESLPVLRIIASDPPQPDPQYAPPCFHLAGSRELLAVVAGIAQKVQAARNALSGKAPPPANTVAPADLQALLRFRTLNEYGSALSHALINETLTPYEAYGLCLKLLSALRSVEMSSEAVLSTYDHMNPWPPFEKLQQSIDELTRGGEEQARWFDLRPLGNTYSPEILGCAVDSAILVSRRYTCVLAVASDQADQVESVVRINNIKVGSPRVLQQANPQLFVRWQVDPLISLPPIHGEGGSTRFLAIPIDPNLSGWRAILNESWLAVRYTAKVQAGGRQFDLRLKFRLYLVPNPVT